MGKRAMAVAAFFFICLSGQPVLALSTEQVLALKKAGVDDQTIRAMIAQEAAAQAGRQSNAGVREIKDGDGNTSVIYSPGFRPRELDEAEQKKLDRAWDMLQRVIIDGRK
jgi:hypothetical protein